MLYGILLQWLIGLVKQEFVVFISSKRHFRVFFHIKHFSLLNIRALMLCVFGLFSFVVPPIGWQVLPLLVLHTNVLVIIAPGIVRLLQYRLEVLGLGEEVLSEADGARFGVLLGDTYGERGARPRWRLGAWGSSSLLLLSCGCLILLLLLLSISFHLRRRNLLFMGKRRSTVGYFLY